VEKLATDSTFFNVLAAHEFVGWVISRIPKVEMVPATRKMVTAVILAVRSTSIIINRLIMARDTQYDIRL